MLFDYTNNEALFCYESTLKIWNIIIKLKNSSKMSNWRFHQNSRVNERKVTIKQKKIDKLQRRKLPTVIKYYSQMSYHFIVPKEICIQIKETT